MRIVLDTNVLVAGLLSANGPPAWIVEAVLAGELELALDMAIREEYEEVLRRPEFRFGAGHVEDLLAAIDQFGVADGIDYVSTGGGAFLEYVEGKTLPAVKVLEERAKSG